MKYLSLTIIMMAIAMVTVAQDKLFPSESGIIDVTKAPYNAKGDGVSDDWDAIQQALSDHPNGNRIIYLPAGTYLISHTLTWPEGSHGGLKHKRTVLQGQHMDKTIIKLMDAADSFQNVESPRELIYTGRAPAQRFGNEIRDLTINTGTGNPGAIGLKFISNNYGMLHNITIKTEDETAFMDSIWDIPMKLALCLLKI